MKKTYKRKNNNKTYKRNNKKTYKRKNKRKKTIIKINKVVVVVNLKELDKDPKDMIL